ncbi:hypothetical protein QTP88_025452 [Uroleucon formosanum]
MASLLIFNYDESDHHNGILLLAIHKDVPVDSEKVLDVISEKSIAKFTQIRVINYVETRYRLGRLGKTNLYIVTMELIKWLLAFTDLSSEWLGDWTLDSCSMSNISTEDMSTTLWSSIEVQQYTIWCMRRIQGMEDISSGYVSAERMRISYLRAKLSLFKTPQSDT